MDTINDIILKIKNEEIDCNNQELFFSAVLKGLMLNLSNIIKIRNEYVPHMIIHTGDDIMYLQNKGQNDSIEPYEVSNEDYIYNTVPRCVITPAGVDVLIDQLTNPYSIGQFQLQTENNIYTLQSEFRRIPVKLTVGLKYRVATFRDSLELLQQIITKLSYIKNYNITYMGQIILCSYKIPSSGLSSEYLMDLDGTTQDSKDKSIDLDLEVETNLPYFTNSTVMSTDKVINFDPTKNRIQPKIIN